MNRIVSLLIALILATCVAGAALAEEPLRVGMECDYAPFNWTQAEATDTSVPIENGGYADGYDVQIARRIADALGRELVIVRTEWDGLTMSLVSGKIDAIIAGMSPTAERALTIDFSDPYYESDLVVVVRGDSPYADATTLADLSGASITGQLNTFHYSVIGQIPDVQQRPAMESFPAMIVALNAGAIDGYVSERPGAVSAVAANPDLTFVSFAEGEGFEASPEDVAIAVGLAQNSDLLEPINELLATISREDRQQMMDDAVASQPLSE
ncbi:transporter substrate-binding domain-containing protein [Eubacteriales bacterium OttesenSCG-928-A19]|nr:transporter substrate-binding domain-containing protein [Eubacteriales bacterium OttesenSCG-928-A19]